MRIAIGCDHRGVHIKRMIASCLESWGHEVFDEGTDETIEPVDYPDYAAAVAHKVSNNDADRGVLICGTGIGMCVVANKFPGVRAAVVGNDQIAKISREHNDINVLCLSVGTPQADRVLSTWLTTEFEGGRHGDRIEKIKQIENSI